VIFIIVKFYTPLSMAAVPTLTHDHMKEVLNQPGVSVIDVRDVQELSHQWRIEGARNIPRNILNQLKKSEL